ncbi:MAG: CopD family protein, partial [Pseudomonadota bacterium]
MTTSTAVMQTPGGRAGMALAFTVVVALGLMLVLGDAAYLWLKALHVVAVISWMAGMVYLPRLFVYHADAVPGGEASET